MRLRPPRITGKSEKQNIGWIESVVVSLTNNGFRGKMRTGSFSQMYLPWSITVPPYKHTSNCAPKHIPSTGTWLNACKYRNMCTYCDIFKSRLNFMELPDIMTPVICRCNCDDGFRSCSSIPFTSWNFK